MTIQRLSQLDFASSGTVKPLKVCVASFFGAAKSGGVGTATSALIKHLASAGHKVTLLYTLVHEGRPLNVEEHGTGENSWHYWKKNLEADGVALEFIPHQGHHREWAKKSWLVKEFIAKHDFDVVYFNDWQGNGYYSLLAKRAGMAPFSTQLHCVITHSAKQWICDSNNEYLDDPNDIEHISLERKSIEMADVVIGPSHYILREYESYGWMLPEQSFYQPLPLELSDMTSMRAAPAKAEKVPINEIVFFGRLEARKGLWIFCEALDRVADKLKGKTVTFMGPVTFAYGLSSAMQIVERSARWPFQIRLLTGLDTDQALEYLKTGNRLAVMPSLADNSPCVIYECIETAVPFVSTLGSGTAELIDSNSLPEVMVEPNVTALAAKLEDIVEHGASLARPSFDSDENLATWSKWHRYVAANKLRLLRPPKPSAGRLAIVDVPLFVFIDDGNRGLGQLAENLAAHLKRFDKGASFIVLTSRRGAVKDLLSHLFSGGKNPPIRIFDPSEIDDARAVILSSQFVFFLDADVEILTPFFALALDMLARNPSAPVTCVGAVQRDKHTGASIENLPMGDLPGLSVFARSIGGPVWGVVPSAQSESLKDLELYDRQIDSFIPAAALGNIFMHRCRLANGTVELIPIVGAITHRGNSEFPPAAKMDDLRAYCGALGINPSLAGGGPAWFAIATYGPNPWEVLPETDAALPLPPPLPTVDDSALNDPALLSMAFRRPEFAFQLEASAGASPDRLQQLNRVALAVARQSSVLDLLRLLDKGAGVEFGPDGIRAVGWQAAKEVSDPNSGSAGKTLDSVALYVDARLRIEGRRLRSNASLRAGGPAKLVFLDVPLSGQSSLHVDIRSRGFERSFVRAMVIDQGSGQQIGEDSARISRTDPAQLTIDLYKLYGPATVVVEFSGAEKMEVFLDAIAAR
jgi:glycosyltransferase involved in cell wall biosynthesis